MNQIVVRRSRQCLSDSDKHVSYLTGMSQTVVNDAEEAVHLLGRKRIHNARGNLVQSGPSFEASGFAAPR